MSPEIGKTEKIQIETGALNGNGRLRTQWKGEARRNQSEQPAAARNPGTVPRNRIRRSQIVLKIAPAVPPPTNAGSAKSQRSPSRKSQNPANTNRKRSIIGNKNKHHSEMDKTIFTKAKYLRKFYFFRAATSASRAAMAAPPQQPSEFLAPPRLLGFSIIASGLNTTLSSRVVSGVMRSSVELLQN